MKLGKSNDVIPNDEMELAMLVQNAKSLGLEHWVGARFDTGDSFHSDGTRACCAIGAATLSDDTHYLTQRIHPDGNDRDNYPGPGDSMHWYTDPDGRFTSFYMLGAGFRCAMSES